MLRDKLHENIARITGPYKKINFESLHLRQQSGSTEL